MTSGLCALQCYCSCDFHQQTQAVGGPKAGPGEGHRKGTGRLQDISQSYGKLFSSVSGQCSPQPWLFAAPPEAVAGDENICKVQPQSSGDKIYRPRPSQL